MRPLRHHLSAVGVVAITVAAPIVTQLEGVSLRAYHDRLARGIPTVCAGETEGVKMGDVYTPQQCADMLAKKLPRYAVEIEACIQAPISAKTEAAFISFAYNVGSAGFCHSGTLRKFNKGDGTGACEAMMGWVYSGGEFRQGLRNRREKEKKLCLEGLL